MHKTLILLSLLAGMIVAARAQSFSFTVVGTQAGPGLVGVQGLATADFNGDGRMDVVTTNTPLGSQNPVSKTAVFLAGPTGRLQAPTLLDTGMDTSQGVITADVTGDGRPDILVSLLSGTQPVLFINQGNGNFAPGLLIEAPTSFGTYAHLLAAADFNGDGRLDLALPSSVGAVVLLNMGSASTGWFAPAGGPALPPDVGTILAADFNQDGLADLVHLQTGSSLRGTVYLNTGRGEALTAGFTFTSTALPSLADFDGDGKVDILASTATSLVLHRNLGQGTFGAATPTGIPASAGTSPVAADFDGDGRLDVALGGRDGILTYRNAGTGIFTVGAPLVPLPTTLLFISVGDTNGDGRPDIVGLDSKSAVTVLLNSTVLASRTPQPQTFMLIPNPATTEAQLALPAAALPAQVDVYTLTGQLAQRVVIHSATSTLSVQDLRPGLYAVRVYDAQGQQWMTRLQVR